MHATTAAEGLRLACSHNGETLSTTIHHLDLQRLDAVPVPVPVATTLAISHNLMKTSKTGWKLPLNPVAAREGCTISRDRLTLSLNTNDAPVLSETGAKPGQRAVFLVKASPTDGGGLPFQHSIGAAFHHGAGSIKRNTQVRQLPI